MTDCGRSGEGESGKRGGKMEREENHPPVHVGVQNCYSPVLSTLKAARTGPARRQVPGEREATGLICY